MPEHGVLFVDDDVQSFAAWRRALGKLYPLALAASPKKALGLLARQAPSVLVVDPFLPDVDGAAFLLRAKQLAPDTLCVVLLRPVAAEKIVELLSAVRVYALLGKPCSVEALRTVLDDAFSHLRSLQAERQALNATVRGIIKLLTDLLSLSCPEAFEKATRVRRLAVDIARYMAVPGHWQIEAAAMLSQLGQMALSRRRCDPEPSAHDEQLDPAARSARQVRIAHDLLANIPRFNDVARIVLYQEKGYDGSGPPDDQLRGEDIPDVGRGIHLGVFFRSHSGHVADAERIVRSARAGGFGVHDRTSGRLRMPAYRDGRIAAGDAS